MLLRYVLFSPTRWWRGSPTGHSLCWVNTAIKKHPFGVSIINPIHTASFSLICSVFIPFRTDVQLGSAARLVRHQGLLWLVRVSPTVFLWCDVDAHIWHHIRTSGDVWASLFLAAFPLTCLCVTCGHDCFSPLLGASVKLRVTKCDLLSLPGKQDKEDDIKVGVKSTALRFQGQTKVWLSGFAVAMMSGLMTAGISAEQTLPYYATLSATAVHLFYQVMRLKRSIVLLRDGVLKSPSLHPTLSYRFTHWTSANQRTAGRNLSLTVTLGSCYFWALLPGIYGKKEETVCCRVRKHPAKWSNQDPLTVFFYYKFVCSLDLRLSTEQ